eukprot:3266546-Heterocapsa_arctica.AAC.1
MALQPTWHSEYWAPAMIVRYATSQPRPTRYREWARAKCSLPNNVDMYDATLSEHEDGRRLRAEECG